MLRVNKKLEYGMMALLYLSDRKAKTASVREIAQASGIPEPLLSKIMQRMKGHAFVEAVYGNQGGYRLNRNLSEINLLDLTQAVVGPLKVASCLEEGNSDCPALPLCTIVTPMTVLNQKVVDLFRTTTLDVLANRKVAV